MDQRIPILEQEIRAALADEEAKREELHALRAKTAAMEAEVVKATFYREHLTHRMAGRLAAATIAKLVADAMGPRGSTRPS